MRFAVISVYTGELPCIHICSIGLQTTPSNLLNGLGHSSGPYTNTHTANGSTATTPSMGPHSQLLQGPNTGSLSRHKFRKHLNSSTIPVDKWSVTYGIPLTLQLEQTTATMEAWLLQYQAERKRLAKILTQERRKQGTITRFLISRTQGRRPDKPPG